jgi:hypothetical protein
VASGDTTNLVVEELEAKVERLKGLEDRADLVKQLLARGAGLGVKLHGLAVEQLDEHKCTSLVLFPAWR